MENDLARILIHRDEIQRRVKAMARDIENTCGDDSQGLVIVPVLAGSLIFVADLMRCLSIRMNIGLMTISRYRGKTTEGAETHLVHDLNVDIHNRHVLVVDDILDTGRTLRTVVGQLKQRKPASIRVCVLLRKPDKAPSDFHVDFVGFDIEDAFVVGYGLDFNDHYRNWPDIGILKPELYQ